MVIKRTPVGDYSGDSYTCESGQAHQGQKIKGKIGGTLRRGWTVGEIRKEGSVYKIDITNPVEYATYIEFGHRKNKSGGWVPGHFMMTISENEIKDVAPQILEKKLKKMLGELLK